MGKEISEVRKLVKSVRRKITVDRAIVFGSRARGNNLQDSDLDLIIVSGNFRGIFFTDRPKFIYPYWKARVPLEVICLTPEEFDEKRREITIIREAVRDGISL